jgi:hypothetical protein
MWTLQMWTLPAIKGFKYPFNKSCTIVTIDTADTTAPYATHVRRLMWIVQMTPRPCMHH